MALLDGIAYLPYQWHAVEGGSVVLGIASHWAWGDLAVYPTLAGIAHGFIYAREYHAKRLSELRLRSLLAESELQRTEAELQALKAELNPHFLFNTLNNVSSLMHTRVDDARRVVAHLFALLRRVLESSSLQEVSVEEEVEFIRLYLEIEQARFGDALRIVYHLDPATLRARVPHLLIQLLVENAVKHGLRPRDGTGQAMLSSERVGGFLQLMVADDGVGPGHTPRAEGTGLANVRQRLRQLYGEHQSLELAPAPTGSATASIRISFTRASPHGMTDKLRVLIVDDEPPARAEVRRLLETHADVEIVGECADGARAIARIQADAPNLVILDIQMPEVTGFGVLRAIGAEAMPMVIFITAYEEYAPRLRGPRAGLPAEAVRRGAPLRRAGPRAQTARGVGPQGGRAAPRPAELPPGPRRLP